MPYPIELSDAILQDANRQPYGYISEYSYSFYPDMKSQQAKQIGYFRFDFHPQVMGNGDTGDHPYFHLHALSTGEDLEELETDSIEHETAQRQSMRFPSGLILPDMIVSSLEARLAPRIREKRIAKAIDEFNWHYLTLDLTPIALKERIVQKHGQREWKRQLHTESALVAMRRAGWNMSLF
jgi:hypothetical protein